MKRIKFILTISLLFLTGIAGGQELSKSDIEMKWTESPNPGCIHVTWIKNKSEFELSVLFTNEYDNSNNTKVLQSGEERSIDITCNLVRVRAKNTSNDDFIQIFWKKKEEPKPVVEPEPEKKDELIKTTPIQRVIIKPEPHIITSNPNIPNKPLTIDDIIPDFNNYLESIPFLALSSIEYEASKIDEHINNLRNWKDKDAYISKNNLNSYILAIRDSLTHYNNNTAFLITDYIDKFGNKEITNKSECVDSIQATVMQRLGQREANINRLEDEINSTSVTESFDWTILIWILLVAVVIALPFLFVWLRKRNKKSSTTTRANNDSNQTSENISGLSYGKKTIRILKKQSLEDVIDNDAYMVIDCYDFCADSAVRRMYIKNTCIKDIYNMYAEDLRNPNNPKEDGCLVLGRWVHDAQSNEYYVSLEQIVLPGDDAVFSEYELNFGGKIKLKVTEKLRKLRRETNLQYDLTCWVHSHPGLGVFFSNSDSSVQMQLKHPTHPNFLTAIVVDVLTPQQELGIFTFKRDSSINSKADLKKLYSLEDWYKWAVESDRNSFKPEDHYNTLANANSHQNECYGIELSNGSIIDMGMLVAEKSSGLAGMVHGFSNKQGPKTEHVASIVSKNEAVPDNELVGCFVIATHCSIPSIRKVITSYIEKIKFVLVYTTTDGLLTSIPVINKDICTDEKCYGEQKLEDLKIWTRRKR